MKFYIGGLVAEGRGHDMSKMETFRVRPHTTRAGSDLCLRPEGVRTVLCNPRQTEVGLTRRTGLARGGQRTFVFWRHLLGGQYGMAEEFT